MTAYTLKRPRCPPHSPLAQRLAYYTDRTGGADACWTWTGSRRKDGYALIGVAGVTQLAHRLAWIEANGPIPDGKHVLHHCDVPACINPAHLWIDTHAANMADMVAKGRVCRTGAPPGERNGRAKLTEKDVLTIRGMKGGATVREIATRFGVHSRTIQAIRAHKKWKHVA